MVAALDDNGFYFILFYFFLRGKHSEQLFDAMVAALDDNGFCFFILFLFYFEGSAFGAASRRHGGRKNPPMGFIFLFILVGGNI